MVNRTQTLVLSFLLVAWLGLGAILVVAPEIYDQSLRLSPGDYRPVEGVFLVAITAFLTLLGIGVLRLWRWTFWLFLVAFLAGVLRVPASILQWLGRCGTCSSKHSS
jgi:hypothetical protein